MNRESDEDCLALIATIRDRAQRLVIDGTHAQMYGTHSETERLLGNLEARIADLARLHSRDSRELREIDSASASGTQEYPKVPFVSTSARGIMDVPSRENQAEVYLPRATGESTRGDMRPLSTGKPSESGVGEPRTDNEHEGAHLGRQRLLDNLEARIEEGVHPDCLREKDRLVQENLRLRGQLADLGTEFVKLTGEVERLQTECEEKDIVRSCSSLRAPKDAESEQRVRLIDCPCGTESCRAAWREAQADEPTEAETRAFESARLDLRKGMPNFRDIIREEVRKEVEQELAPVCSAITEVEQSIFKASAEIGEARRAAGNIREEVAAEVARQLREQHEAMASPAIRTWVDNLQHELDKLRAALEAKVS